MTIVYRRNGYTLMELLGVLAVIGVTAAAVLPHVGLHQDAGDGAACQMQKGVIEAQVQLWLRDKGALPATSLGDIGSDTGYFPAGLPTCPAGGGAYTIDASTGRVTGHDH
ncbi:MAG: prepilin-type N-terminal cleavage/methylation domain-containing protein [Planctomycetota bacterium]